MEILDRIKLVSEAIHLAGAGNVYEDGIIYRLTTNQNNRDSIIEKLDKSELFEYEDAIENEVFFELKDNKHDIRCFTNLSNLLYQVESNSFKKDFAVLDFKTGYLYYNSNQDSVYSSDQDEASRLISYLKGYLSLSELFRANNDHYNSVDREFVFYSESSGIFIINNPNPIKYLEKVIGLEETVNELKSRFETAEFKACFINQLAKDLKNYDDIFHELIQKFNRILESTIKSHELFLSKFSFEKFKGEFEKQKEGYFDKIRSILGSTLNQIIAIPVSITAAVYAILKIEHDIAVYFILIAFLVYTLFIVWIFRNHNADIKEIKSELKTIFEDIEFRRIIGQEDLSTERGKINRRISNIRSLMVCIQIVLVLLLVGLFLFNFIFLNDPTS